jgi:tRNA-splicing ligase RtcB
MIMRIENVKAKIFTDEVEELAIQQIKNVASLPFIHKHIAVMPDVHAGYGCTVGSVIPTYKAVIPAAVGVDIGCGMIAVRTNIKANELPESLAKIRSDIEAEIPVGFAIRQREHKLSHMIRYTGRGEASLNRHVLAEYETKYGIRFSQKHIMQVGTLGGGNHFIELCLDENQDVWIMLHSGSRGIGNIIGSVFIDKAKEEMARWHIDLPDKDLAYLPEGSEHFTPYIECMLWAQNYAILNREVMLEDVVMILKKHFPHLTLTEEAINCHHNYCELENHYGTNVWVARKGAVRARENDLGIIPGSMGAKSFIVRGKGEKSSFTSCSHGAGRKISRTEARKLFTLDDHRLATEGIECRKDEAVIDETPGAYKDIDKVMADQKDLVDIVHTLKQVMCIKG